MRDTLVIRPVEAGDALALMALYAHLNPDDPVPSPAEAQARIEIVLAHPGLTLLAGFVDGLPVTTCTLVVIPGIVRNGASYALIENVVTHPDHRQRGHAARVLAEAVERAWASGCYKAMLLAGSKDPAVLRFYETCGFTRHKTGFEIRPNA